MTTSPDTQPVIAVPLDRDTLAYQPFIGQMRKLWASPLYRRLRDEAAALGSGDDFGDRLLALPAHQVFGWLEYNLPNLKYVSRHGIAAAVETHRERLEQELSRPLPQGCMTENSALAVPDYYQENDFHQHPGGLSGAAIATASYAPFLDDGS